jgi:hypothetical protein
MCRPESSFTLPPARSEPAGCDGNIPVNLRLNVRVRLKPGFATLTMIASDSLTNKLGPKKAP